MFTLSDPFTFIVLHKENGEKSSLLTCSWCEFKNREGDESCPHDKKKISCYYRHQRRCVQIVLWLCPLASPSMRGATPLDVAAASVMDNNELALALREPDLEKVRSFFSLQSCC